MTGRSIDSTQLSSGRSPKAADGAHCACDDTRPNNTPCNRGLLVPSASPWKARLCCLTTTMRSNLVGYVIGLATTLATSWSTRRRRQWHSLFGLLGFALRFAIAFPICLWLYSFLDIVRYCIWSGGLTNFIVNLAYCPLLALTF